MHLLLLQQQQQQKQSWRPSQSTIRQPIMQLLLLQQQKQSWRPSQSTVRQPIALNPIASQKSRWSSSRSTQQHGFQSLMMMPFWASSLDDGEGVAAAVNCRCSLAAQEGSRSSRRRTLGTGVTMMMKKKKKATSSVIKSSSSAREQQQEPSSVSVIIPMFNEVASIPTLVERVGAVMQRRGAPYEIICVDDGSTDGSTKLLKKMAAHREDMRVVILSRNFGQTAAMAAGFDFAVGQMLVTLDGDLQNDAEDIPTLLHHLVHGDGKGIAVDTGVVREDGGYDLVCGWRRNRKDNFITRNLPSTVANWLIGNVTGVKLHDYGCSLKAYRASLVSNMHLYGEMHRFIPVLAVMEGAAISEVEVRHHPRMSGTSKYGLGRIFRVILDLTTVFFWLRFRDKPMHFMGFLGGICILGSLFTGAFASLSLFTATRTWGYRTAIISNAAPSYVLSAELLIMGLQLVCLGLLAEMCVRFESHHRRPYRVREVATSGTKNHHHPDSSEKFT